MRWLNVLILAKQQTSLKFYFYRGWPTGYQGLKMENEDKEGITYVSLPSLSQVWSPSQKPKTRGIIVQGLLTPRWLVFLFPAPAEGWSTSGVAVGKKTKSCPFQVDAAVDWEEEPNPRNQTNQFEARQLPSCSLSRTCFFLLFFSRSSHRRC